jgi:hypothetical protein
MAHPIALLNLILAGSQPHQTIRLPYHQAEQLATLGERELGALSGAIAHVGCCGPLNSRDCFPEKSLSNTTMRLTLPS